LLVGVVMLSGFDNNRLISQHRHENDLMSFFLVLPNLTIFFLLSSTFPL